MTVDGIKTIGLIGADNVGSQIARAAIASGYDVVISNSRGPTAHRRVRGTDERSRSLETTQPQRPKSPN
jgi:predicted dinucleotide-binding enzyme